MRTTGTIERSGAVVYKSAEDKTDVQAHYYLQTHQAPHRYLAYRDIPAFIQQFVTGRRALDYGAGTGSSASFLYKLGFDVTGTDISFNMLEKARGNFPHIRFCHVNELQIVSRFDLVFSSFVLLELSSKKDIIAYLSKASSFLREEGIFIAITGSEQLHSLFRKWSTFNVNFMENSNLFSGKMVKLALKSPKMEFYDYFWREEDYLECIREAGMDILQIHYPCGALGDPYAWKDESFCSPFAIFIAKKMDKKPFRGPSE